MPTYDYECTACKHAFEAFHAITADPVKECPACGGLPQRLIGGGAGFLFKGSGFYQTDYRSAGYKKEAGADKPAADAPKKDEKSASNRHVEKAQ